jgi:hypothetical protein
MPDQSSRHIASDTRVVETDELRDLVGSVFILGLPQGSDARALAVRAADDSTSYLRGKAPFKRAGEQLGQISAGRGAGGSPAPGRWHPDSLRRDCRNLARVVGESYVAVR